jgi:Skp family chaperone for outer membrane proteins
MNRYLALAVLGVGLMASPLALNLANSAVPSNPKIGLIDVERTLTETPAGKRANDAFEKQRKAKQAELDKEQADLKKADADLDKQATILKPEVLQQKKAELEKQFVALQQTYVNLAGERTKLIQSLLQQADPVIKDIARAEGVQLIVDREAAVWWDQAIDLTPKLQADKRMQ